VIVVISVVSDAGDHTEIQTSSGLDFITTVTKTVGSNRERPVLPALERAKVRLSGTEETA
jgi:hypothetical protein